MEKVQLQVTALSGSESSPGNFVVVLEDMVSRKRLPVIIGAFEAQAIAICMEKLSPPRPLTHDLFAATLRQLEVNLREVYIHSVVNGAFICALILFDAGGKEVHADARTSDGLALAVRFQALITVAQDVFDEFAFAEVERQSLLRGSMWEYSIPELEMILSDLLAREDYESAARVRDVINKKSQTGGADMPG